MYNPKVFFLKHGFSFVIEEQQKLALKIRNWTGAPAFRRGVSMLVLHLGMWIWRLKDQLQFTPLEEFILMCETKSLIGLSLMITLNWLTIGSTLCLLLFLLCLLLSAGITSVPYLGFFFLKKCGCQGSSPSPTKPFP